MVTRIDKAGVVSSATGSVERTLEDRFADTINVKDFGATGDGVTDDTAAIQAALNAGRDIYFPQPSDHYVVSGMLHIGWNGTIITGSTAQHPAEHNAEIVFTGNETEYALFNFNNSGGTLENARTVVVNNLSIKLKSNDDTHISAFDTGGGFSNSVFKNVSIYGAIDYNHVAGSQGNNSHYGLRVRGLDLGDNPDHAAAGTKNNDQYHNTCYNCYFEGLKIAVYWDGDGHEFTSRGSLCNGSGLFECRFKYCALHVYVLGDSCCLMNNTFLEPKRCTGFHTGSEHATVLTDTLADFDDLVVGGLVKNTTDQSTATIEAYTATTITLSDLEGGTDNKWQTNDTYKVAGSYLELHGGASGVFIYNNYFDTSSTTGPQGIIIDDLFTPNGAFFQKNTLSRSAITDNTVPYNRYESTGQSAFAITFDYLSTLDIEVYLNDVRQYTGYTIDDPDEETTEVTFASAPASETIVLLKGASTPRTKGYVWHGDAETEVNYLDVETRIELREIDGDDTAHIPNDGGDPIRSFIYFDDDDKIKARIGSTTTTLANRTGDFVDTINVKDYGAVGDCVVDPSGEVTGTDDTAAIQAAIDAGAATTPAVGIYLPPGNYRCDSKLELKDKVGILGAGMEVSSLLFYGTGTFLEGNEKIIYTSYNKFTIDLRNAGNPASGMVFNRGISRSWFTEIFLWANGHVTETWEGDGFVIHGTEDGVEEDGLQNNNAFGNYFNIITQAYLEPTLGYAIKLNGYNQSEARVNANLIEGTKLDGYTKGVLIHGNGNTIGNVTINRANDHALHFRGTGNCTFGNSVYGAYLDSGIEGNTIHLEGTNASLSHTKMVTIFGLVSASRHLEDDADGEEPYEFFIENTNLDQTADNASTEGSHTGGTHSTVLTDPSADWDDGYYEDFVIKNITDGSQGTITSNTATTITVSILTGGDNNNWQSGDEYAVFVARPTEGWGTPLYAYYGLGHLVLGGTNSDAHHLNPSSNQSTGIYGIQPDKSIFIAGYHDYTSGRVIVSGGTNPDSRGVSPGGVSVSLDEGSESGNEDAEFRIVTTDNGASYSNPPLLSVDSSGNTTVDGTLDVAGNTTVDGTLDVADNTTVDGTLDVTGDTTLTRILLTEKTTDQAAQGEGSTVIWMSDGSGSGADGDIMVKITAGATTNTFTLVDFEA